MTAQKSGEFRGKTVELAVQAGLETLRLSRDDVEIEVVRPGSRGVLGIGAEDAIVRLIALQPAKPKVLKAKTKVATVAKPKPEPVAKPNPEHGPRPQPQPRPKAKPSTPQSSSSASITVTTGVGEQIPEAVRAGREFLTGLLERMNIRADVEIVPQSKAEAEEGDRMLVLNIVGEDLELLIGRRHEVLSALEFITRLMVNQRYRSRGSFVVDVNGYRARRAGALHKLALRMADQAVRSGRTMVLEPMSPAERRIIHLALRDHPAVSTQSVGEGDHRKVTIIPKKK